MADAITPRYKAFVVLGAASGLRLGELLGLGVGHVRFLERSVRVERQLLERPRELGPVKTEHALRVVPTPGFALDEVAEHLRRYGTGPDELVFSSRRAGWSPATVSRTRGDGRSPRPDFPKAPRRMIFATITRAC